MNQLLLAIILSILPVSELRIGLPIAIDYASKNNIPLLIIFSLILFLNILVIFFVFFFLDYVHHRLLRFNSYRRSFGFFLKRIQKKADKLEKKMGDVGFLALTLFVAVPLPATGAYTGAFLAWLLGLNRKKSFLAISAGVLIAGIIVLAAYFGGVFIFNKI